MNKINMDRLKETLTRHEGFRDKPYKCSRGYWTLGIGRNLESAGLRLDEILCLFNKESSQDDFFGLMFENDIEQAKKDCWKMWGHVAFSNHSAVRQEALINLMFNMGYPTLHLFRRMHEAVRTHRWQDAADELLYTNPKAFPVVESAYHRQVGYRAKEVAKMLVEG